MMMAKEVEKKRWVRDEENLTLINWWGTLRHSSAKNNFFFILLVRAKMEWWAYACNRIKYLSNTKHQEKKNLNDGKQKIRQRDN